MHRGSRRLGSLNLFLTASDRKEDDECLFNYTLSQDNTNTNDSLTQDSFELLSLNEKKYNNDSTTTTITNSKNNHNKNGNNTLIDVIHPLTKDVSESQSNSNSNMDSTSEDFPSVYFSYSLVEGMPDEFLRKKRRKKKKKEFKKSISMPDLSKHDKEALKTELIYDEQLLLNKSSFSNIYSQTSDTINRGGEYIGDNIIANNNNSNSNSISQISHQSYSQTRLGMESLSTLEIQSSLANTVLDDYSTSTGYNSKVERDTLQHYRLDDQTDLASPRAAMIRHSILKNQLLLPSRDVVTPKATVMNLSNAGIGDDKGLCLAEAIERSPHLMTIDLTNNRLTDTSLTPIMKALVKRNNITNLNLSDNKIDSDTVDILKEYLQRIGCPITELHLSKADFDDRECAEFIASLAENTTLTHLDMSHNLIGEMEEYNVVVPDFETGGEAIAEMLISNRTLKVLNLSWNKIRGDTAYTFAEALGENFGLESLNLSHNNLGDEASELLCHSLRTNPTITDLDLSYNNIKPKCAFVLAAVLESTHSLRNIWMNGNCIGSFGIQLLMRAVRVASARNHLVNVFVQDVSLSYNDATIFNRAEASGKYDLDLSKPYDQAVASSLTQLANTRPLARFDEIKYKPQGAKRKDGWMKIELVRQECSETEMIWKTVIKELNAAIQPTENVFISSTNAITTNQQDVLDRAYFAIGALCERIGIVPNQELALEQIRRGLILLHKDQRQSLSAVVKSVLASVFSLVDEDGSNEVEADELTSCLELLGMKQRAGDDLSGFAKRLIASVDSDKSGTLDLDEFIRMWLVSFTESMPAEPSPWVTASSNYPFQPEIEGRLMVKFKCEPLPPGEAEMTSDLSFKTFYNSVTSTTGSKEKQVSSIEMLAKGEDFHLSAEQAEQLMESYRKARVPVSRAVKIFFPRMANAVDCCRLLTQHLSFSEVLSMRSAFGNSFRCLTGSACGHYTLDLSSEVDRVTFKQLVEINNKEKSKSMTENKDRNTSQTGSWNNFRNATINWRPLELTGNFFEDTPQAGVLRFDFVSTSRPIQGLDAIGDEVLDQILGLCVPSVTGRITRRNKDSKGIEKTSTQPPKAYQSHILQRKHIKGKSKSMPVIEQQQQQKLKDLPSSPAGSGLQAAKAKLKENKKYQDSSTYGGEDDSFPFIGKEWIEMLNTSFCMTMWNYDNRCLKKLKEIIREDCKNKNIAVPMESTPMEKLVVKATHAKAFRDVRDIPPYMHINEMLSQGGDGTPPPPKSKEIALEKVIFATLPMRDPRDISGKSILGKEKRNEVIQKCVEWDNVFISLEIIVLYNVWINCSQLKAIIECLQKQNAPDLVLERIICLFFTRIVDLSNFGLIVNDLSRELFNELSHRLGILNIWSPMHPDGNYELHLSCWDHRTAAKLLIRLALIEPGPNWANESLSNSSIEEPIAGWELPMKWTEPDDEDKGIYDSRVNPNDVKAPGPRRNGILRLKYQSDPELGCAPIIEARRELAIFRTLAGTRGSFIRGKDPSLFDRRQWIKQRREGVPWERMTEDQFGRLEKLQVAAAAKIAYKRDLDQEHFSRVETTEDTGRMFSKSASEKFKRNEL